MKAMKTIFAKELKRIFSDKKMVFSMFVLPVFVMIGMYGLIGFLVGNMLAKQEEHIPSVAIYYAPEDFKAQLDAKDNEYKVTYCENLDTLEANKDAIYRGDLDLIMVFTENFTEAVKRADVENVPNIDLYYNPSEDYSNNAYTNMKSGVIEDYRNELITNRYESVELAKIFTINKENKHAQIQDGKKASGKMLGAIVPYMVTIFIFATIMSLGTDMIVGEKEKGTLAGVLLTPINRTSIVYGKLFALMVISAISAVTYIVSMVVAMPLMLLAASMSGNAGEMVSELSTATASMDTEQVNEIVSLLGSSGFSVQGAIGTVAMLGVVIITLAFLYVALVALPSAYSRNMKECSTYIMPIYILVLSIGMVTMLGTDMPKTPIFAIPLYGPVVAMKYIFTGEITFLSFVLAVLSNVITGAALTTLVAKIFDDERVMFDA